jgi:hypothetical protein
MGAVMGGITPVLITMQTLDEFWPKSEHYLEAGLGMSFGEMSVSQLRLLLAQGNANLICLHNSEKQVVGAFAVQFINFPNYRLAHIISIGGQGLLNSGNANDVMLLIKKWLKDQGATKLQGYCQPSRERLWRKLGCTESYRVVRMEI